MVSAYTRYLWLVGFAFGLHDWACALSVPRNTVHRCATSGGFLAFHPLNKKSSRWKRRAYSTSLWSQESQVDHGVKRPGENADLEETISKLVQERAEARRCGDYTRADELMAQISSIGNVVLRDQPRSQGGGTAWKWAETPPSSLEGPTVLQLAHVALGRALTRKRLENDDSLWNNQSDLLMQQIRERLEKMGEYDLQGRKAADAGLWLALAGIADQALFESLADVAAQELDRFGKRASCRSKDIWHVLERFGAAGLQRHEALEQAATRALKSKDLESKGDQKGVGAGNRLLNLSSDRSLLTLWRFSTRQQRQRYCFQAASAQWEREFPFTAESIGPPTHSNSGSTPIVWSDIFENPARPLVVDVGCGMGVSLLGLSQMEDTTELVEGNPLANWSGSNYAGVDLNGLGIGYARGLAKRWGLDHKLHFFQQDAESFLQQVIESYPGPVQLCLIQFPTPYRMPASVNFTSAADVGIQQPDGNSRLPVNVTSGFMVTPELLSSVRQVLVKKGKGSTNFCGKLLIQSNCEDVALWMRHAACRDAGFCVVDEFHGIEKDTQSSGNNFRIPKRTQEWVAMGGERARGKGWCETPLLPNPGRTETEVACTMNGTPIHRCVLIPLDG